MAAFGRLCAALTGHGIAAASNTNKGANVGRVEPVRPASSMPVSPVVTPPPENAKAIARKAFAQSMLSPSTIALASHLIERFNLDTGRCDPGSRSLANDLGISVRQVRRSIASLVASGLFGKARHGGKGFANAYQPNWPLIVERAAEGDIAAKRPMLSAPAANVVTQNHLTKPDSVLMVGRPQRKRAAQRPPDRRQMTMVMPITGGRDKSEEAVRAKLSGQVDAHMRQAFLPSNRPAFVEGMRRSIDVGGAWDSAISAEMRRHGDGLPVLLQAIDALGERRKGIGGSGR